MVHAENKYEARLLDKENTWGKPTDEQEKIVAMTVEINSSQEPMDQLSAQGHDLVYLGNNEDHHQPTSLTQVPKTALLYLWTLLLTEERNYGVPLSPVQHA